MIVALIILLSIACYWAYYWFCETLVYRKQIIDNEIERLEKQNKRPTEPPTFYIQFYTPG